MKIIPLLLIKIIFFTLLLSQTSYAQIIEGVDYSDRAEVANTFDMTGTDIFGQRFPSEHLSIIDEETGVKVIALTTSRHANSKMYQTHPQWTPDGKYIVFRSDRNTSDDNRKSHAYAISMGNYEIVQVTTGDRGSNLHLGWNKNIAYYFQDNDLIAFELGKLLTDSENGSVGKPEAYESIIAKIPGEIKPSGIGLDINEDRVFFSSRQENGSTGIYSVDFKSGKTNLLAEVPFRVGHLQSNPFVSGEIMYCWETGGDAPQRMWYLSVDKNGEVKNRPVYQETANEWVTHEVFMGPDHILFNVMGHLDRLQENPTGIVSHNIRTGKSKNHGQADDGGYWHAAGTKDLKWAVGDTFNGDLYRINLETNAVTLLTTGHRPNSKSPFSREAHSHHNISPDGKWVLFNSSMLTESDIMLVPLHPEGL